MANYKMSDVFNNLAIVSGRGIETWELQDTNGNLYALFYGHQHCISAAKAIGAYDAQQAEIEALKAQVVSAEKKGYWQGFETGSIRPGENILQYYNEWLELKKANAEYALNQQGDSNGK